MREKHRALLLCLLLAAATLGLYWPAVHFDFINYDDPDYVTFNPEVQHGLTLRGIAWAFTTFHASNWHPLTWISHMADASLYGPHPAGHHFTSILLHMASVVLLFLVLWQWTGVQWRSALVAALFALHPLHVESVAWISERKDVLCAFFWLLTMLAYYRYATHPNGHRRGWYGLALTAFALGLLCKPMIVTLPLVLLVLDFWPLNRLPTPRVFLEKIPFAALAGVAAVITLRAQHAAHSIITLQALPFSERLANALVSYVFYLWKMIWPADLALPYPFSHAWTFGQAAGAGLLLAAITVFAFLRIRRQPYLVVGWLWFLITLLPVIGLVQVGTQFMADRYTYLPLTGIFLMLIWAIPETCFNNFKTSIPVAVVATGIVAALYLQCDRQLHYWSDSATLFEHTVAVTGDNLLAEYNLGEALARRGDEAQAIVHYQKALALRPGPVEAQSNPQPQARYNLGLIYLHQREWASAEELFRVFVKENPGLPNARRALAEALAGEGRDAEAKVEFQAAAALSH